MNNKLKVSTKLKYGIGDFGMSLVSAMLSFSMLFYYTDVVGVNPGLAGTAMLVGKLCWDMVNDVLFGYFEDKTKSRWGKRRPYLIFCSIPFALAFWSVFSIPQGLGNVAYFFLIIGTFILEHLFLFVKRLIMAKTGSNSCRFFDYSSVFSPKPSNRMVSLCSSSMGFPSMQAAN